MEPSLLRQLDQPNPPPSGPPSPQGGGIEGALAQQLIVTTSLAKAIGYGQNPAMSLILRILPAAVAVLCLIAFIPWTLGIPGTENDYARGWTIGYYAICWYLLAFAVLRALDLLAKYSKLPISRQLVQVLGLVAVAGFVIAQIVAWPLILS